MEFDEYDYLEKIVENTDPQKLKEAANGGEATLKSEKKERTYSSKHKIDENDVELDHRAKRSKSRGESRDRDLYMRGYKNVVGKFEDLQRSLKIFKDL
ncbi:hypothetical protein ACSBR1_003629 [Camellia fascicularis]